ncbi:MAG: rhomboid family intramembrane serine protease [Hyphomicrobiaceae bacterium]
MSDQPIFNVPVVVPLSIAVLAAVEVARELLPADLEAEMVLALAVIPARLSPDYAAWPGGLVTGITSLFTYMLVHGGFTHLFFNAIWLLVFGGAVAKRIGAARFLAFALVTSVIGAIAYVIANYASPYPMVGASGADSGLMAGSLRFFFSGVRSGGFDVFSRDTRRVPLTPIREMFRDPQILTLLVIWALLNVGMGLGGDFITGGGGGIAWEAHLGGFVAGLFLFPFFDKGNGPRRRWTPRIVN